MEKIKLFRRRFLPDELIELKDDKILRFSDGILLTKWNTLKPRDDIASGISAYFLDAGIKISKIYNASRQLVHWYCDIIEPLIDEASQTYTFLDLLIDVIVYPDGSVHVVDLDEFADMLEQHVLDRALGVKALRRTNALLEKIYDGHFPELTQCIDEIEKTAG